MFSYFTYKTIHFLGIFLLATSLSALWGFSAAGGRPQRWLGACHGTGLALALLGGFGMLARLNIHWPWPSWIWGKFLIWIFLGGAIALAKRQPKPLSFLLFVVALLAAAVLALYKP